MLYVDEINSDFTSTMWAPQNNKLFVCEYTIFRLVVIQSSIKFKIEFQAKYFERLCVCVYQPYTLQLISTAFISSRRWDCLGESAKEKRRNFT